MKLLTCVFCDGEVDIIDNEKMFLKKIRCRKCGFTNADSKNNKTEVNKAEVIVIKKRCRQ